MSDKLDPRIEPGKSIADKLETIYNKGFHMFAGPVEFRHATNYDTYRRAALLAVYTAIKDENYDI